MIYDPEEKLRALEAIIFAAEAPCDEQRIASVLDVPPEDVEGLVEDLRRDMEGSALQIVRLAGGYHMATRPRYAGYVQRLREPEPERLSPQALETVAIIAYLQPITRPEIDEIRGVNSTASINSLIDKGLVEITGRKDAPGRPFLLATTPHFLSTFGLNDLDELPEVSTGEADFREQLRELVGEEEAAEALAEHAEDGGAEDGGGNVARDDDDAGDEQEQSDGGQSAGDAAEPDE